MRRECPVIKAEHDATLTPSGRVKSLSLPFEFDALLVEAIKEQQQQIKTREAENVELKQRLEKLEQLLQPKSQKGN